MQITFFKILRKNILAKQIKLLQLRFTMISHWCQYEQNLTINYLAMTFLQKRCQIKSLSLTKLKMGKQKDLNEEKKSTIVRCLAEGRKPAEIAKELCRDRRTVKRFIANANQTRKRCDKGVKEISRRQMFVIKREAVKQSLLTSKQIFEQGGVSGIDRTTRCRTLNTVAELVKPSIQPPLTTRYRNQRLEWAKKYVYRLPDRSFHR